MSPIISALIAALVPILADFLVKWLTSLFNKVSKGMDPNQFDSDGEAAAEMVQAAHDATPRIRIFKRALLRKIKDHAAAIVDGDGLSKADKKELAALGSNAASE